LTPCDPAGTWRFPRESSPNQGARWRRDHSLQRNPGAQEFERLKRAIEAVKLEVPIAAEFPLAQAAKAQERVEAGHILGKIVLRIR